MSLQFTDQLFYKASQVLFYLFFPLFALVVLFFRFSIFVEISPFYHLFGGVGSNPTSVTSVLLNLFANIHLIRACLIPESRNEWFILSVLLVI